MASSTISPAGEEPEISLFVYGTLKSGLPAHERFFPEDSKTCRAAALVGGSLFALPAGYPALRVPREDILAVGTSHPLSDARTQAGIHPSVEARPAPESTVHGEVVRFTNPGSRLPALDEFEGFVEGGESLYLRVLITAWTLSESPLAVWAYAMESPQGHRLLNGNWEG